MWLPTKPVAPVTRTVDMELDSLPAGPSDRDGRGIVASTPWTTPDPRHGAPLAGPALRRLVEAMPKAELHLHLDGSLRVDTALELARTRGIDAPRDWAGMSAALIAPMPCRDQAELLRAFDLPIALMQDAEALERITAELVETKAADGVRYVEIRWGPLLHVAGGLTLGDGIAAVCAGRPRRRVPDRHHRAAHLHRPALARPRARTSRWRRRRPASAIAGLTGWDLAGPEAAYPDPLTHAAAFDAARDGGLRITVHAGEWGGGDAGPPRARGRAGADRARAGRGRRSGAVRRADHARA